MGDPSGRGKKKRGMGDLAREAAGDTNAALQDQELTLLLETSGGWERLRPKVADKATYDALIREVSAATSKNESIAQLRGRIEALGSQGLAVAKKVFELIKSAGV